MSPNQQTLRVTGLPPTAVKDDVQQFFQGQSRRPGSQVVQDVGPICREPDKNTNQTTVTFSSSEFAKQALQYDYATRRLAAAAGGVGTINLDLDFRGITTLQSIANPETGKPDIDIVALHGLNGHAWNTFTASQASHHDPNFVRENNWLQNNLPRLLQQHEQRNIHARVMAFGYDADVWMSKSVAEIEEPVRNLLWYLSVERQDALDRPLFFIAHSLGGIVVKQVVVKMANDAISNQINPNSTSQGRYIFPVQGCLFFGVPHKGSKIANLASPMLTGLAKFVNVNQNNIRDLQPKSQRLEGISNEFVQTQEALGFPVLSFYENSAMNHVGVVVPKESAIFDYPGKPEPFGIDKDHREMVKILTDYDQALRPALHFLAQVATRAIELQNAKDRIVPIALAPNGSDPSGAAAEDRLSILGRYDTVFLIDDSSSMAGLKWEMVKTILDYCTPVATHYDSNGIDIHFFNNEQLDQENVRDPGIAVQIHHDVRLYGSTPLLDRLSVHLRTYFQSYKKSGYHAKHKRLNLIILTDGEPDEEFDENPDKNDPTKPAFKLIRQQLVNYAKKLASDDVEALPGQVGIQFCQIGTDQDATEFFRFLDDRLKGKHKLDRDMVDTIQCKSHLDLTEDFFRKLLTGAIDKKEDNRQIEEQQQQSPTGANAPNGSYAQHKAAQYAAPSRTGSSRTDYSSASADVDNMRSPSRGYSFPVDPHLEPLQEQPASEGTGNQPSTPPTTRRSTFRISPSSPGSPSVVRTSTFDTLKRLGRK